MTEEIGQAEQAEQGGWVENAGNRPQPKKEKVRPAYQWFLGVTGGVLIALFVLSVQWKDSRKVARIDVSGAAIFAEKDVRTRARVAPGSLIDTVSLTGVRRRMVSHPYIRDARVSRIYPGGLRIELDERVPVASFMVKGAIRYVDAEGVVLPYLESAVTHDLPTITGVPELATVAFGDAVDDTLYFEAIAILNDALETDSSVVIIYESERGVPIRIGRGDTKRKMAMLRAFWARFVRDEGPGNLEYLDLRFGDKIVAKWTNKPQTTVNQSSM
jgi:cell division protein FtsQ